jgi:hypothetical protein
LRSVFWFTNGLLQSPDDSVEQTKPSNFGFAMVRLIPALYPPIYSRLTVEVEDALSTTPYPVNFYTSTIVQSCAFENYLV